MQDVRLLHADAVYLGAGLQRGARGSPDLVLLRAPARPRTRTGLRRLPSPRLPGFSSSCPSKGEHTELHAALKTRRTSARAFIRGPMGSVLGEQGGGPALMDTRPTPDPRPRWGTMTPVRRLGSQATRDVHSRGADTPYCKEPTLDGGEGVSRMMGGGMPASGVGRRASLGWGGGSRAGRATVAWTRCSRG